MSTDPHAMDQARHLYTDGLSVAEIAPRVGRSNRTVRGWIRRLGWKKNGSPEARLEAAIVALTDKAKKSDKDWRDLDRYSRNLTQLRKGDAKRAERVRAHKMEHQPEGADKADSWAFAYQRRFLEDNSLFRIFKKARQIGWTLTIAWEGLTDALKRGRDKGYMSASFRQTRQINRYIKQIGRNRFGLKLRGTEVIRLPNGAEINFFASNEATAQGFSGDMYFDEFAWLRRARECFENAAAIATLKDYRITIGSTPSVHSHYFEELWDESRSGIKAGRHQVTIIDAIEQGNNLIDLGKIQSLFSPRAIRRLYMCETLDDQGAVFTFDEIMACVSDDEEDSGIFARRPSDTIWGGLDIARERDDTSVIFVAVDQVNGRSRFTWRHRHLMNRVAFKAQETRVKNLIGEWRPEEFTIDQTTIGEQLAEAVADEMPSATLARFTPRLKAELVLNMQDIVSARRLRIPMDQRLIDSFLAIMRKALETDVGYEAARGEGIGHADDFWALALACHPEWGGESYCVIIN